MTDDRHLCQAEDAKLWEAISGLRDATRVASEEREKAAEQLRRELERSIVEGDARLRDHIEQQYQQVWAALLAADKLEVERVERVEAKLKVHLEGMPGRMNSQERQLQTVYDALREDLKSLTDSQKELLESRRHALEQQEEHNRERLDAVRRELTLIQDAAKEAVAKAEGATEKRFEAVNGVREGMREAQVLVQQQLAEQAASFLPREVADTKFAELAKQVQVVTDRVTRGMAVGEGVDKRATDQRHNIGMWVGVAGVAIAFLAALVSLLVAFAPS